MSNGPQPSPIRVGIIGAGQLARMMGEVAHEHGIRVTVLANSTEEPAVTTCDDAVIGDPKDPLALSMLAQRTDVVTFDHELVDLEQIRTLERDGVLVRPSSFALEYAVDKAHQRRAFHAAQIPVPRFLVLDSASDPRIEGFLASLGEAPVLKAARGGYDGRGVLFPENREQALSMISELCQSGEVVIEERLELLGEVAQLLVRGADGATAVYPLVTTVQKDGMCIEVTYPSFVSSELSEQARALGEQIASLIDVVGVLAVEFFVTRSGLIVNEVALRPHNSGHWTIEGTRTSQFANHLLAVAGVALGNVSPLAKSAVMVNVVGSDQPSSLEKARDVSGVFVHDYGKTWRPGRKLGHVTAIGDDRDWAHVRAWEGALAYGTRTREA